MQSKHLQATIRRQPHAWFRLVHVIPFVLLLIVVALSVWLWRHLQDPVAYPINHIVVESTRSAVSTASLEHVVKRHLSGGFFSLDTTLMKQGIMQNPWVKDVSLRREWPDTLRVEITEHTPIAWWGQRGVLAADGAVFFPKQRPATVVLPQIDSPLEMKASIMTALSSFSKALSAFDVKVNKIAISNRLAWQLTLNNGVKVNLCREQVGAHFQDFVRVYPTLLAPHIQDVVSVNLCYPNGLAVQWRNGISHAVS